MRLFPRLFLSHLLAIGVALGVLLAVGLTLDRWYYQVHVADVLRAEGFTGVSLYQALERGHRKALLLSFLTSLPLSVGLAAFTSLRQSRLVAEAGRALEDAAHTVSQGRYHARVALPDRGELTEVANSFNEMASALGRLEAERLELITAVAHELRTPLAALQGYAEGMADGVIPVATAGEAIRRETGALRAMANDLLLAARVDAGAVEVRPVPSEPARLLQDAAERFAAAYDERHVRLVVAATPNVPKVWADPDRTLQVLSNLLSNALRHTPAGGRVTLAANAADAADAAGAAVTFAVSDTGPGVPRAHQDKVFERFYRADDARSRARGGVGIGLAVSKGLVEAMGGRIWLESEPGSGAVFRFTLPVATGRAEVRRPEASPPPGPAGVSAHQRTK